MSSEKTNQIIETWKYLWTTELEHYVLVTVPSIPRSGYTIHRIPENLSLIIENDEEYNIVVEHMLKAKVTIMSIDEYRAKYFPKSP